MIIPLSLVSLAGLLCLVVLASPYPYLAPGAVLALAGALVLYRRPAWGLLAIATLEPNGEVLPPVLAAGSCASPESLGDFRILRQLGRGGMGVVYEAEQISIPRRVALKILPLASLVDPRALQRFKNEVAAVATLEHANIVPVYAVGEQRGIHYYAMKLIRGQSLAAVIRERYGAWDYPIPDAILRMTGGGEEA